MSVVGVKWERRRVSMAALGAMAALLVDRSAFAQDRTEHSPIVEPSSDAGAPPALANTSPATPAPDLTAVAAELAEQKKALAEAKAATEDLQAKVDAAANATDNDWTNKFKIYGFTDVGVERIWVKESSPLGTFFNSANATSFVVGNLNVYFDAQPVKGWRSLVEVRFTNAPNGEITNVGGLGGTFKRTSTMQIDPNSGSVAATMWGAYTVIERAHIDWTDYQFFKLRVGNFFTPFGIWNVDHGSPTLIGVQLPGVIQLRQMPLRQTGIQAYGSTFRGNWELAYAATISNGRQELSNFAFDDNRGYGGRLSANNEQGDLALKFGASFYTGRVRDQEVDLVSLQPVRLTKKSTFSYREVVGGLDASVDVGRTRLRAEAAMQSVQYVDGKHEQANALLGGVGQFQPNRVMTTGYFLAAHQLPFELARIEPYVSLDTIAGPLLIGNLLVSPTVGLNIGFTKAVMLKTAVTRSMGFDTRGRQDESEVRANNSTSVISRLVLVF